MDGCLVRFNVLSFYPRLLILLILCSLAHLQKEEGPWYGQGQGRRRWQEEEVNSFKEETMAVPFARPLPSPVDFMGRSLSFLFIRCPSQIAWVRLLFCPVVTSFWSNIIFHRFNFKNCIMY